MTSEIGLDSAALLRAVAAAGADERLRATLLNALREAESEAADPVTFREAVRWPLVLALLDEVRLHRVELANGLVFEVSADSRIERALLLSSEEHPDHVWEPQTTRLLTALAEGVANVIVGGAYIGDHVLPMARVIARSSPPGVVHAFEPMAQSYERLRRNLALNGITNVATHQLGLWDESSVALTVEGHLGLGSATPVGADDAGDRGVESVTIDDYARTNALTSVGLIMLDTEGGEERALLGAVGLLDLPAPKAPNIVFEIHRHFVDWSDGLESTTVVRMLTSRGYSLFAIRDFHDNYPMAGQPVEVIPIDSVYLDGPPHGFNTLATKDAALLDRLGLKVVKGVSPKLIRNHASPLHQPTTVPG